ncbi:KAR5 [Candida pseudojiufengensis]|uniref:KAR5 n=1 Tax=Candida pseudojiufengensis TaxID=497109 RepID=UPI0022257783|nr:KAR5 [Candida pseudojiufengensis]KAI5962979.1 KAR5 [Candida pseudojiufengensis]
MFLLVIFCFLTYTISKEISVWNNHADLLDIIDNDRWEDKCSRLAFKTLPSQCSNGIESLSPSLQKKFALELSICEFENIGIEYPLNCNRHLRELDIDQCIKSLEKSPQFWTTYSGNYNNIKNACHHLSLPFEKDQILNVYKNITNVYQNLMSDLQKSHQNSEENQNHIEKKFNYIINLVDQVLKEKENERINLNRSYNVFYENFDLSLKKASVIINNSYNGVSTNMDEIAAHLNYFSNELRDVYKMIQNERMELELHQKQSANNNVQILNQQEVAIGQIKNITEQAKHLQYSTNELGQLLNNQLSLSAFQLNAINDRLAQNMNDLESNNLIIKDQSRVIVSDFSNLLNEYLNSTSQTVLRAFESAIQNSLYNLDQKILKSEESITMVNERIEKFLGILSRSSDILEATWEKFKSFTSIYNILGLPFKLFFILSICWILIMLKPIWKLVLFFIRGCHTIVLPSLVGVVTATISLRLISSFRVLNSIE